MSKIQLSQRMYSIADIIRLLDNGELSIQPKYQRRRTPWPTSAKTALMDTILNNFPVPPIYLRDYVNDYGKRQKEIIDGQQRISTIIEFYKGKFQLSKSIFDEDFYNCRFEDLPLEAQLLFEDFEVSFISIRGASESDIVSIFSRLNSFSLPLNPQEKLNALYAGELKTQVYELATDYNTFWLSNKILTTHTIARMFDSKLVSDIVYAVLYGVTSYTGKDIDNMYKEFDEEFPLKNEFNSNFNKTMTVLGNLYESQDIAHVFKPTFMFYSLFLVVYARLFGFKGQEAEKTGNIDIDETRTQLEDFSFRYLHDDIEPAIKLKFKQATNNIGSKRFRHESIFELVV